MPFRDPGSSHAEVSAALNAAIAGSRRAIADLERQEANLSRRVDALWHDTERRIVVVALLAVVVGAGVPFLYKAVTGQPLLPDARSDRWEPTAARSGHR